MRWTPLTGERVAARRHPIAATRNECVSLMLLCTPFGILSCNGNAAAFAGRSRSSRTTPYRWRCARRWERFGVANSEGYVKMGPIETRFHGVGDGLFKRSDSVAR